MPKRTITSPADIRPPPGSPLWVFAYGSLMWNPGFPYLDCRPGLLRGFHRSFCILSTHYRGTPAYPGLVFGLDHGGACRGMVFQAAPQSLDQTIAYLWDREMITDAYQPRLLPVQTDSGSVTALAFTVSRGHNQYCGRLCLESIADRIVKAEGDRGRNIEYLANTVEHLRELGIQDALLESLLERVMHLEMQAMMPMAAE